MEGVMIEFLGNEVGIFGLLGGFILIECFVRMVFMKVNIV